LVLLNVHISLEVDPYRGAERNLLPEEQVSVKETPTNQQIGRNISVHTWLHKIGSGGFLCLERI